MARLESSFKQGLLDYLRRHHADMCRHWFDEIEPLDIEGGVVRMLVREPVQLKYLQRCCVRQFTEAAQQGSADLYSAPRGAVDLFVASLRATPSPLPLRSHSI